MPRFKCASCGAEGLDKIEAFCTDTVVEAPVRFGKDDKGNDICYVGEFGRIIAHTTGGFYCVHCGHNILMLPPVDLSKPLNPTPPEELEVALISLLKLGDPPTPEKTPDFIDSRYGATRRVFLIGKYAIKFPSMWSWDTFLEGLQSNMRERVTWKARKHRLLAPVLYADPFGIMLIMPRADRVCNKQDIEIVVRLWKEAEQEMLPIDENPANIGLFSGVPKLVDYGS